MKALLYTIYKEQRDALFSFDEEKITAYCRKYGVEMPPKDHPNYEKIFWGGVAKVVLLMPDVPATVEKRARDILALYGLSEKIGFGSHEAEAIQ